MNTRGVVSFFGCFGLSEASALALELLESFGSFFGGGSGGWGGIAPEPDGAGLVVVVGNTARNVNLRTNRVSDCLLWIFFIFYFFYDKESFTVDKESFTVDKESFTVDKEFHWGQRVSLRTKRVSLLVNKIHSKNIIN